MSPLCNDWSASVYAGVQYGKNLFEQGRRSPPDELGIARTKIDRFNLFNHDESGYLGSTRNSHMEREAPVGVGERTDHGKTRMLVE